MAGSLNKCLLIGNCGKDPEIRTLQNGDKVVSLTLATSETWNDKSSGERKEKTEWHRVVVFNDRTADFIEKYVHRGSKIYVEGQLQTRKWTDQSGAEKYTTEVVVGRFNGQVLALGDGGGGGGEARSGGTQGGRAPQGGTRAKNQHAGAGSDLDDEIPF